MLHENNHEDKRKLGKLNELINEKHREKGGVPT